jgi:twitching motility protein PilT
LPDYVPDPEIVRLVRDLNESVRDEAGPAGEQVGGDLDDLLRWAAERGASDLLLVSGSRPVVRIDGEIAPAGGTPLSSEAVGAMLRSLLDPPGLKRLASSRSLDLAFERPGVGRFRANVHFQQAAPAIAVRLLPAEVPELGRLGLPAAVTGFARLRRGLVLLTGPTGSGKSTTLAALLHEITTTRACHVVTIEQPVEYRLDHGRGLVEQVEIGRDAPTFAGALRSALRQDPDVILIGEMRDPETIGIALTAAETGHLVLATLHTGDTSQAIDRIVDVFPAGAKEIARAQLAGSLRAVVAQILLPAAGGGRVPACEVLLANDAVRNQIRKGDTHRLHQEMSLGKGAGMVTLEEALANLVRAGKVRRQDAEGWARHPKEFQDHLGSS